MEENQGKWVDRGGGAEATVGTAGRAGSGPHPLCGGKLPEAFEQSG